MFITSQKRIKRVKNGYFVLKWSKNAWSKIDYFDLDKKKEMQELYPQATYEPVEPYLVSTTPE